MKRLKMSKAARAADTEQSDREYIIRQQKLTKELKDKISKKQ